MARIMNDDEHRWGARIRVSIPVQVTSRYVTGIDGRLMNLSLSGALMKIDFDLPINSRIQVMLKLPAPLHGEVVIEAHVARKFREDVGVEWCQFAPNAVKDWLRSSPVRLPV